MVKKYGKPVDMRMIHRNINGIAALNQECKKSADKFDVLKHNRRASCVICNSVDRHHFLTVYERYNYYECRSCGALTLEKYPDVKKMYTSDETENLDIYIDEEAYDHRVDMIAKPKVEYVIEVLKKCGTEPSSWLDIGCGGGELLYYIKNTYGRIECAGLESDESEWRFCNNRGLHVQKKFIDVDIEDKEITELLQEKDVVSLFNVLEHVEKPVEYIDYLYRSMKKGSFLVVEVPKHPSLGSFANLTSMDNIYRHIVPPVHLQIFSLRSLELLMSGKFEVKGTWEFGQGFMDVINNAMLISGTASCELYDMIANEQNKIQKAVDEAGLADQVLLIAKKLC